MNKALAVNLVEQPEIIELLTRRRTSTSRPHRGPPAYLRLALGAAAFAVALHFNPPGSWLKPRPILTHTPPLAATIAAAHAALAVALVASYPRRNTVKVD